jgi:predicted DNA-binding transcriptional regulator AlpA
MSSRVSSGAPRLLRRERAADYLGISTGVFDRFRREGKLPPPRKVDDGIRSWDRLELDAFVDDLPHDGEVEQAAGPSDLDRLLGT